MTRLIAYLIIRTRLARLYPTPSKAGQKLARIQSRAIIGFATTLCYVNGSRPTLKHILKHSNEVINKMVIPSLNVNNYLTTGQGYGG